MKLIVSYPIAAAVVLLFASSVEEVVHIVYFERMSY
jgi:hypothetical protein